MREMILTKGKVAIVDDEDYDNLLNYHWHASPGHRNTFYARRGEWDSKEKKMKTIRMNRQILNYYGPDVIDHIDGNPLNNQKSNLRVVTSRTNSNNRHHETSSGLRGISWHTSRKKWRVYMRVGGKQRHFGFYSDINEAIKTTVVAICVELH